MKIMSGTVVLVLLYSGGFALAAEPNYISGNGLMFPESVERAMMMDAVGTDLNDFVLKQSGTFEGVPYGIENGPLQLFAPEPNSFQIMPQQTPPRQLLPFGRPRASQAPKDVKDLPEVRKATRLLRERKFGEALAELRNVQRRFPDLPPHYIAYRLLAGEVKSDMWGQDLPPGTPRRGC